MFTSRGSGAAINSSVRFVLLVLLAVTLSACDHGANPVGPAGAIGIMASGHPEWPPIMFQRGAVIDGAGPALVKKIFDALGISVVFPYEGTWDQVQAKARSGEVDVLVAAYKTTEREGYMVYSDPYTTDPVAIYVGKGKAFPYSGFDDLVGRKGIAMLGDSYGQAFDDFAAAHLDLRRVATVDEAFDLVNAGSGDYLLYSLYAGNDYLKKAGTASQFESLPTFVAEENFYITISRKSRFATYLPQVNQEIAKNKANGTVAALITQFANQ
jgi:polar amino acid transport system substrate-binding protein